MTNEMMVSELMTGLRMVVTSLPDDSRNHVYRAVRLAVNVPLLHEQVAEKKVAKKQNLDCSCFDSQLLINDNERASFRFLQLFLHSAHPAPKGSHFEQKVNSGTPQPLAKS